MKISERNACAYGCGTLITWSANFQVQYDLVVDRSYCSVCETLWKQSQKKGEGGEAWGAGMAQWWER